MDWAPDLKLYPKYLHKQILAGRGLYVGPRFLSWRSPKSAATRATLADTFGIRTGRSHDLATDRELIYLWLRERDHDVIDIREGFPILHLSRTLQLYGELGASHPARKGLPEPLVITFLITRQTEDGKIYEARSIRNRALGHVEETQSLRVTQSWCEEVDVDWKLVDTKGLGSPDLYFSLIFIRNWFVRLFEPLEGPSRAFAERFMAAYTHNEPLAEMQARVASQLGLKPDVADDQFRFCAWARLIDVDVTKPIALNRPLYLR